jgi:poly(A) polymerase
MGRYRDNREPTLLFRYSAPHNGSIEKKAHVYTQAEHGIDPHRVDPDAMWVVRRLRKEGFHAYVVGGAVRDLILERTPKDFDIATDAHPQQLRRLFRSARVIGRRFRLVHVYTSRDKYIEVTTFRSLSAVGLAEHAAHQEQNNLYGTIEEDAERRDFTINALYYCPIDRLIVDYVGGFQDLRQRRMRTLSPAESSFAEDPVRMIRAVKYAALIGFPIPLGMASLIRRKRESLLACSRERVTEEVYKILTSGGALAILELSARLRLFEIIFPRLAEQLGSRQKLAAQPFGARLEELDSRARDGKLLDRTSMFGFLFHDLLAARSDLLEHEDPGLSLQHFLREACVPLYPSKKDLAVAVEAILKELRPPHRPRPHGLPAQAQEARAPGAPVAPEGSRTGGKRRRRRRGGGGGGRGGGRPGPGRAPGPGA